MVAQATSGGGVKTTMLRTIDAHADGEPLRLVVDGFPAPRGKTMLQKADWVRRHADHLRRALLLEPRGHADMSGALLTEPVSPGSHAGIVFMDNDGYGSMCGHAVVAATTIALERGLVMPGGDGVTVIYDTPAGTVRARATLSGARGDPTAHPERRQRCVTRVSFLNVPSFVLCGGLSVRVGARHIRADVAFGGAFFAIVDSEAMGLPLDAAHLPDLRRAATDIRRAVEAAQQVAHPLEPRLQGLYGAIFTGPAADERADLRSVAIVAGAQVDRSPCGAGTAAVMAVLDAMGLIDPDRPFVHEGLIGTRMTGRVTARTEVGGHVAIVPEIEGAAWITGEHTFLVDEGDPLAFGVQL